MQAIGQLCLKNGIPIFVRNCISSIEQSDISLAEREIDGHHLI